MAINVKRTARLKWKVDTIKNCKYLQCGGRNRFLCSNVSQTILNMFCISVLSASSDCAIESSACFDERRARRPAAAARWCSRWLSFVW